MHENSKTKGVVVELPTGISVVIQQLTLFGGWLEPEPVGVVHWLLGWV
jgi:hypothetical protein